LRPTFRSDKKGRIDVNGLLKCAALAAPIALAACGNMVTVTDPVHPLHYVQDDELYAGRNGGIRVEVDGSTFGLPADQFAQRVVDIMRASYYRRDWFTLAPSRATDPRFRIVMMFNPDPGLSANEMCAAPQPFQPVAKAPGETTVLFAAFCGTTEALSETTGRAYGGVTGVDDPKFRELVAKVTNSVIAKNDWNHDSGWSNQP
jgi:hypothetical protein